MSTPNVNRSEPRKGLDLYNTPVRALEALDENYPEVIRQVGTWWDPCSGLGVMGDFIEGQGGRCINTDIFNYGYQHVVEDFLKMEELPVDVEGIIMNPPYLLTKEFIDHAVYLLSKSKKATKLLMFNRLAILETKVRSKNFKSGAWPLSAAYIMSFRVSCSKGIEREPTSNSVAYAWYEFTVDGGVEEMLEPRLRWII